MARSSLGYVSFCALAFALAMPAYAQEGQDDEEQDGIREIIVTAQKREESAQSVPVAITALDAEALDTGMVQDIRDVAGRVPSLVIDSVSAGPSAAAISIRGISFEDIEKSFDPTVGVVVDGVFIGTNTGQLLDSFDLDSLQVLRGPQGTLFGRNTIGGVIEVKRSKPTEDAGAKGRFSYGKFDTKSARVVLNSGKLGDFIAIKAFGFYDKTDGFVRNLSTGGRDGKYETLSGGVTALIEPSTDFSAEITYEHMRERGETVSIPESSSIDLLCLAAGVPGFSPVAECNRFGTRDRGVDGTFQRAPHDVTNDTDAITGNITWNLGDKVTLSSVTGYRTNDENVAQDFDGSSADFFATRRIQQFEQFSQEVRVLAELSDMFNLLVGGYYYTSNYQLDQFTRLGPVPAQTPAGATLRAYTDNKSTSYAGFADAQITISDRFKVSVGGRYTRDKKSTFNNYGQVPALVSLSQPSFDGRSCVRVTGVFGPGPLAGLPTYGPATNCSGKASFGKFTWRANATYEVGDNKNLYASYSTGFRSGGFNGRAASPTSLGPYFPETVKSFEVGLKADWLDRTLRTNIALFHTKYDNKQEEIVQPSPPGSAQPQETVVANAASAKINGAELEFIIQPVDEFNFTGSFSYLDAKYGTFLKDLNGDNIGDDVSTLTLRRAPKFLFSAGANFSKETGSGRFDANLLLRFQSKTATCITANRPIVFGAVTNDLRCFTKDRENLSGQVSYTFFTGAGEISIAAFGRNLTNTRDISSTLPVAGLFTFSGSLEPRTYGMEVGFKF
jgi:iron complex outermembrane recepter protein